MLIYLEKQAKDFSLTKRILSKFKNAQVLEISNYKNIFDKKIGNLPREKSLILASLKSSAVTEAPAGYGYNGNAYFFKTSLNCIFDCSYCYLKGAFKSSIPVIFVNYEEIQEQISKKISAFKNSQTLLSHKGDLEDLRFYSSDYSDIQGFDSFSEFNKNFIPFFEKFENVKMETRTKNGEVSSLLDLGFVPKNTEIAFSLNPQELISKYEKGTSSLDARLEAANKLLEKGFLVGLRFLPLLPVPNYLKIYSTFLKEVSEKIDLSKIHSTFATGLLYTKNDYSKLLQKNPDLDILHRLSDSGDGFFREERKIRDDFYKLFREFEKKCIVCLDS